MILKRKLNQEEDYVENDLVMGTSSGTQFNPANVRRILNALIKKTSIPRIHGFSFVRSRL